MNNREQFKIDSIEELEQAYEMFKDEWMGPIKLKDELNYFRSDTALRYILKSGDGYVFLSSEAFSYKKIPSPLKNKSMFNQELIQKLREGKIAVKNDGSLEQLQAVLKEAFPEDNTIPNGSRQYYAKKEGSPVEWLPDKTYPNMLSFSIENFFKDLKGFPKKYVLREPNHLFEDELSPDHPHVDYLTKAGVFEVLYKPIYEEVKPDLPEINGYKGDIVTDGSEINIKYGCAFLSVDWFKETKNRHILYLTLNSSGVVIDALEMQQIRKYLKYYDYI